MSHTSESYYDFFLKNFASNRGRIFGESIYRFDEAPKIRLFDFDVNSPEKSKLSVNRLIIFRILVARPEHAGIYECKAESVAGDDKLSFNLDVHQPPTMITSNKEVSGIEGQNLVLECAAEGHPKPEIIWRKNGQKINLNSGGI